MFDFDALDHSEQSEAIARLEDEIGDAAGESDKAFDFIAGGGLKE